MNKCFQFVLDFLYIIMPFLFHTSIRFHKIFFKWFACNQGMAPLSAAEKQRRYRARRDVDHEIRQQYLNKEKERWRKDIDEVSDLSEREKRAVRKKWRERKRKLRKNDRARTTFQSMNTPPTSPDTPPEPENSPLPGPSRSEKS